jgi:DNA-binding CsgD family transcriptional regulator
MQGQNRPIAVPSHLAAAVAHALTARERASMALVAEGKTDWEMGVILGVSENTARFHVDNARRKLGAVSRAHAVARFILSGCYADPARA